MVTKARDYQEDHAILLADAAREAIMTARSRDLAVIHATGAGKTITIRAVLGLLSEMSLLRQVVIAAPQIQIRSGFETPDELIEIEGRIIKTPDVRTAENSVDLIRYLNPGYTKPDKAMTVCHAILARVETHQEMERLINIDVKKLPFLGMILIPDEAHHSAAPKSGLGEAIRLFRLGGGIVLSSTATPFGVDGKSILPVDAYVVYRTMASQMEGGKYAPEWLDSLIIDVKGSYSDENDDLGIPDDIKGAAKMMVETFIKLGRPKSIIQVRNSQSESLNKNTTELIAKAFGELVGNERVLLTTEAAKENYENLSTVLKAEKNRSYQDSKYDIIIGIQKVVEGTDWKHCVCVMKLGIPKSLRFLEQLIGRMMRFKGNTSCPPEFVNKSFLILFTAGVRDAEEAHARQLTLVSAFLASFEIPRQWSMFLGIQRIVEGFRFPTLKEAKEIVAKIPGLIPDVHEMTEARRCMKGVLDRERDELDMIRSKSRLIQEMLEFETGSAKDAHFSKLAAKLVVAESMISVNPEVEKFIAQKLSEKLERGQRNIPESLMEVLEEAFKEFKEMALVKTPYSVALSGSMEKILSMDHSVMVKSSKMLDKGLPTLNKGVAFKRIRDYRKDKKDGAKFRKWPSINIIPFREYDEAFKSGSRGLPKKLGGLAQAFHEYWWKNIKPQMDVEETEIDWKTIPDWTYLPPEFFGNKGVGACPDWFYFPYALKILKKFGRSFVQKNLGSNIVFAEKLGKSMKKLSDDAIVAKAYKSGSLPKDEEQALMMVVKFIKEAA